MHSSLTRNSVGKGGSRRPIDDVRRWTCMTMPPYYCRYECRLRGASGDYWYQVGNTMFYVPGPSRGTWKFMQNMGLKNTWKYAGINCTSGDRKMDWRPWSQRSRLCTFNGKLCVESFICEYTWVYDARYPPPAAERGGWWYAYAPIVENYYWSKV